MSDSLSWYKEKLNELGLSTSTPGMVGEDRYEELRRRYEDHSRGYSNSTVKNVDKNDQISPLISQLSITDLKGRLTALGENSNTPGLVGEARRSELMKRLIACICGSSNEVDDEPPSKQIDLDAIVAMQNNAEEQIEVTILKPPPPKPKPKAPTLIELSSENSELMKGESLPLVIEISQSELTEMKKNLKRIQNQRAIVIAAQLSGTSQDVTLRDSEKLAAKADAELSRIRAAKQLRGSGLSSTSSLLIDGGVSLPVEKLLSKLEDLRNASKEEARSRRAVIRQEADSHAEYGVVAEETLALQIRDANYSTGKVKRKVAAKGEDGSQQAEAVQAKIKSPSRNLSQFLNGQTPDGLAVENQPIKSKSSKATPKSSSASTSFNNSSGVSGHLAKRWNAVEALGNAQKKDFDELMEQMELEKEEKGISDWTSSPNGLLSEEGEGTGEGTGGRGRATTKSKKKPPPPPPPANRIESHKLSVGVAGSVSGRAPPTATPDNVNKASIARLDGGRDGGTSASFSSSSESSPGVKLYPRNTQDASETPTFSFEENVSTRRASQPAPSRSRIGNRDDEDQRGASVFPGHEKSSTPQRLPTTALSASSSTVHPAPNTSRSIVGNAKEGEDGESEEDDGDDEEDVTMTRPLTAASLSSFALSPSKLPPTMGPPPPSSTSTTSKPHLLSAANMTNITAPPLSRHADFTSSSTTEYEIKRKSGGNRQNQRDDADDSDSGSEGDGSESDDSEGNCNPHMNKDGAPTPTNSRTASGAVATSSGCEQARSSSNEEEEVCYGGKRNGFDAPRSSSATTGRGGGRANKDSGTSKGSDSSESSSEEMSAKEERNKCRQRAQQSTGLSEERGSQPQRGRGESKTFNGRALPHAANYVDCDSGGVGSGGGGGENRMSKSASDHKGLTNSVPPRNGDDDSDDDDDDDDEEEGGDSPKRGLYTKHSKDSKTFDLSPSTPSMCVAAAVGPQSPSREYPLPIAPAIEAGSDRQSAVNESKANKVEKTNGLVVNVDGAGFEDVDEDDADGDDEDATQIKALRRHVRVLLSLGDYGAAETLLERALELDPLDIQTLCAFAVFLHTKRGALARAEAFFARALQVCMPDLLLSLASLATPNRAKTMTKAASFAISTKGIDGEMGGDTSAAAGLKKEAAHCPTAARLKYILRLLMQYARFLLRAKGDVEAAALVYRRAAEIAPSDPFVLAAFAHFLSSELENTSALDEALELFARSMRLDPCNAQHALWYAKLLRKVNKIGQAELMYRVAVQQSCTHQHRHVEPIAICNYATFLCRYRKERPGSLAAAKTLFVDGLKRYPGHKGLRKNISAFLKANPSQRSESEDDDIAPPTPATQVNHHRLSSHDKGSSVNSVGNNAYVRDAQLSQVQDTSDDDDDDG